MERSAIDRFGSLKHKPRKQDLPVEEHDPDQQHWDDREQDVKPWSSTFA